MHSRYCRQESMWKTAKACLPNRCLKVRRELKSYRIEIIKQTSSNTRDFLSILSIEPGRCVRLPRLARCSSVACPLLFSQTLYQRKKGLVKSKLMMLGAHLSCVELVTMYRRTRAVVRTPDGGRLKTCKSFQLVYVSSYCSYHSWQLGKAMRV